MGSDAGLSAVLQQILENRGLPRSLRETIEAQVKGGAEGALPVLVSLLDEASSNPNLSPYARTEIWSALSALESLKR